MRDLRFTAAATLLALASCASAGTKIDPKVAASFQPGVTTSAEVIAKLGRPTNEMNTSDGRKTLIYVYAQSQIRPLTVVPIVGLFAGGSDTTSSSWMFTFGPDGKLLRDGNTNSQLPVSTGLAAGTP